MTLNQTNDTYYRELSEVALPNSRSGALFKLFDSQKKTQEIIDKEIPVFQYYVNLAVKNIQDIYKPILNSDSYDEDKIIEHLKKENAKNVVEKLANFLWLFQVDDPSMEYPSFQQKTFVLLRRIFRLRNFFCHLNESGIDALIGDSSFYKFLIDDLMARAIRHSTGRGLRTEDLFKAKMMNLQIICRENWNEHSKLIHEECTFALTRKGIIFLICMGLHKDDAIEFCQNLHDLKLLKKDVEEELSLSMDEDGKEKEIQNLRKKGSGRKAFHAFFTYFSIKRSYNAVRAQDPNFAAFTDIIGYLNKVPSLSMDNLALWNERNALDAERKASQKDDHHLETQYELHRRFEKRTLGFLAAYCEDFNLLPSLHFKRMDESEIIGRKRHTFGLDNNWQLGQNRHYIVRNDAIRFEYRPTQHYGDIHINALRSAISREEFRRLIIAGVFGMDINTEMERYFSAYHRILERILAEGECDYIRRENYMDDLRTVTGTTAEELTDNDSFLKKMAPYFPNSLTYFFIPREDRPDDDQLRKALKERLQTEIRKDKRLLYTFEAIQEWRRMDAETRPALSAFLKVKCKAKDANAHNGKLEPMPSLLCDPGFSDGTLIHLVFRTLNLHLSNDKKFRQIPQGQIHRGRKDTEFQQMHALMGRFAKNPQGLWDALEEKRTLYSQDEGRKRPVRIGEVKLNLPESESRPALVEFAKMLEKEEQNLFAERRNWMKNHPHIDANGREVQAMHSLEDLARAAIICHRRFCEEMMQALPDDHETLLKECKKFGVSTGHALNQDTILKTILHVDLAKWKQAFNYETRSKWIERSLQDGGHVVTQVPLTNQFTVLHFAPNKNSKEFFRDGVFRFGEALKNYQFNVKVALRDFYDVRPLWDARASYPQDAGNLTGYSPAGTAWDQNLPEDFQSKQILPSKGKLLDIAKEISDIQAEDRLLLYIAKRYHDEYLKANKSDNSPKAGNIFDGNGTIKDYFDNSEIIQLKNSGLRVLARPNDRLRLVWAKIEKYAKELEKTYSPEELGNPIDFYALLDRFRDIDKRDRRIRLEMQSKIYQLERIVNEPILSEDLPKEEKHRILHECYLKKVSGEPKKRLKKFPREMFEKLVDFRNSVFHDGFNLSQDMADEISNMLYKVFGIN